jgi:replicative DNA helicase
VYIDAGYLLSSSSNSSKYKKSQVDEMNDTMKGLRSLATRVNKPLVVTVQFNRTVKTNARTTRSNQELSMESIGGTDYIGQLAHSVLAIHPPIQGPTARRTRILEVLKNRDGNVMKFKINFLFEPPNFDFIEEIITDDPEDELGNEEAEAQASIARLGWM